MQLQSEELAWISEGTVELRLLSVSASVAKRVMGLSNTYRQYLEFATVHHGDPLNRTSQAMALKTI